MERGPQSRAQRKAARHVDLIAAARKTRKGTKAVAPLPDAVISRFRPEDYLFQLREVSTTEVVEFTQVSSVPVPRERYQVIRAADLERIRRRIAKLRTVSRRWHAAAWGTGGIGSGVACAALTVSDGALVSSPLLWTVAGACGVLTACFAAMERETVGEEQEAVADLLHEVDEVIASSEGRLR